MVLDIPKKKFEHIFDSVKKREKVKFDYELGPDALKEIIVEYKKLVKKETGKDFPQKPLDQLVQARDAVFRSWQNDRAKTYRRINHIDDWLGTAVDVYKRQDYDWHICNSHRNTNDASRRSARTGARAGADVP